MITKSIHPQRDVLQSQLFETRAELDILKTLAPFNASKPAQNLQALIQRLVTKEKQVVRLQGEIDTLKMRVQNDTEELVCIHLLSVSLLIAH
jgi:hypothetical protein